MGLGYFFNFYRGKPLVKKGGVLILTHPCYDEFDHEHHPSYIEFFNRLLPETRDADGAARTSTSDEFAKNPSYIEMYRRGQRLPRRPPVLHVVLGRERPPARRAVIVAGAENAHVPAMLGWERADTLTEAIAMARSIMGRSAQITMLHQPVIAVCDMS